MANEIKLNKKFIDSFKIAKAISEKFGIDYFEICKVMKEIPSADVQEVKRGEWKEDVLDNIVCSTCGESFNICDNDTERFIYCTNCGAKCVGEKER